MIHQEIYFVGSLKTRFSGEIWEQYDLNQIYIKGFIPPPMHLLLQIETRKYTLTKELKIDYRKWDEIYTQNQKNTFFKFFTQY